MRRLLLDLAEVAVDAALPSKVLSPHLPEKPVGKCVVIGAGKASAAMAAALEVAWPDVEMSGVVVTRYEHAVPCTKIRIIEAAHPVPDENSLMAAQEIRAAVQGLGADDLVISLVSGGGSALMVAPSEGMSLADKQAINKALLKSGASINDMNVVRQAFSQVKGGKLLAEAAPAQVVTLLISDVPGDDPSMIASGPTVPTHNILPRAKGILERFQIDLRSSAREVLLDTPELSVQTPATSDIRMIATPAMALEAARSTAAQSGLNALILGDAIEGEACEAGTIFGAMATSVKRHGAPAETPCVLLSGGETTVTIGPEGAGRGGRNTEFLLSLAVALEGAEGIYAVAIDTDGIDGTEDAAGAIVMPDTLERGRALGLDPRDFLARHDSYSYFDAIGDLIKTGPTLTNVNDFRAILVL